MTHGRASNSKPTVEMWKHERINSTNSEISSAATHHYVYYR